MIKQCTYQVTVSPWVSQTLARPIIRTAVKCIRKIATRMNKGTSSTFHFSIATFTSELPKLVRPWPDWPDRFLQL